MTVLAVTTLLRGILLIIPALTANRAMPVDRRQASSVAVDQGVVWNPPFPALCALFQGWPARSDSWYRGWRGPTCFGSS